MNKIKTTAAVQNLVMPDNVRIGLMISEHKNKCKNVNCNFEYFGLAFGQSPFFVPDVMQKSLGKYADQGHYSPVNGIKNLRESIADFNERHFNFKVDSDNIVIGNGTKNIIYTLFSMLEGGVVIPSPSWIGYKPQIKLLEKNVYEYDMKKENDYRINPDDLDKFFVNINEKQLILVLNNPHNPTGVVYSKEELEAIIKVCRKYSVYIIADEIYALSTYDTDKFISIGKLYPEGTFVTNGISKDRSCGGWRFGYCILPGCCDNQFKSDFAKVAATYYTNVSTPIQYACDEAYQPNNEIEEYFEITRKIHSIMGNFLSQEFNKIDGIKATKPEGGFYFYADFNNLKINLKNKGINVSNDLANSLISHPYHIAVITGDANMIKPDNFGARIAFVDYNGREVFNAYKSNPPISDKEIKEFIKKNAPRIYEVGKALDKWGRDIKK